MINFPQAEALQLSGEVSEFPPSSKELPAFLQEALPIYSDMVPVKTGRRGRFNRLKSAVKKFVNKLKVVLFIFNTSIDQLYSATVKRRSSATKR